MFDLKGQFLGFQEKENRGHQLKNKKKISFFLIKFKKNFAYSYPKFVKLKYPKKLV